MGNQQQQQMSMLVSNSDESFNWEFINQSDCSSVGGFSDDDVSILDVLSLSSMSSSDLDDVDVDVRVDEVSDHDHDHHQEVEEEGEGEEMVMKDEPIKHVVVPYYGVYEPDYGNYYENLEDEAEDDQDGDDDVDDELVPWEMKNLYVKERIKKSGKRSLIKTVVRSKKMLGSVRGRYGVGLKAY